MAFIKRIASAITDILGSDQDDCKEGKCKCSCSQEKFSVGQTVNLNGKAYKVVSVSGESVTLVCGVETLTINKSEIV